MSPRYHRLARTWPQYAWWKLLLTGILAGVFFLVLQVWIFGIFLAIDSGRGLDASFDRLDDLTDPAGFAVSMVSLAAGIPALLLAAFVVGPRPSGLLWSVEGRLRWRWLGRMVALAVVVHAVMFTIIFTTTELVSPDDVAAPELSGGRTVLLIVLVLLLTPFQSAAEEYVFRGYLAQLVGSLLRNPGWAIVLPVPLFVAGHVYDAWGLVDVGVFGITAGILTYLTGGLEAAIAAHAVNNVGLFLLGAVGVVDANATEGSPWGVLGTLVTGALLVALVARQADRDGIQITRAAAPPSSLLPG